MISWYSGTSIHVGSKMSMKNFPKFFCTINRISVDDVFAKLAYFCYNLTKYGYHCDSFG